MADPASDTPAPWTTTAVCASGAAPGTAAGGAIDHRAQILAMTQTAEDAVLRPTDPGRWPHDLRAALAARIAGHNRSEALAARYAAAVDSSPHAALADPAASSGDATLAVALAFVDRVATNPRDVTAADIEALQGAGISDADIVRLTELVAFMGYQVRLTAGLALIKEMQP